MDVPSQGELMISENDRRLLAEAEEERDRKLAIIQARFKKNAKFLCAAGIVLALYYSFYYRQIIGLGTWCIISMFPLLTGMIVEMCITALVLRKYLRICEAILGPDDDPDPDDEEEIPDEPEKNFEPEPAPIELSLKKAA